MHYICSRNLCRLWPRCRAMAEAVRVAAAFVFTASNATTHCPPLLAPPFHPPLAPPKVCGDEGVCSTAKVLAIEILWWLVDSDASVQRALFEIAR